MSKGVGNIAEISFMLRSLKAGLSVLTPYSSNSPYDVVTDYKAKLSRVQIKSTATIQYRKNGSPYYRIICSHGSSQKKIYNKQHCDYIALYVMPLDLFYIIPVKEVNSKNISIYPDKKDHKLNKYLEAFDLLK